MANDWGKAAFFAGLGGLLAWKSLSPETRRDFWNTLDQVANSPVSGSPPQLQTGVRFLPPELPPKPAPLSLMSPVLSVEPLEFDASAMPESLFEAFRSLQDTQPAIKITPTILTEPDSRWRTIITHPSVVLILGKRGSGKSALGYRLLELFRNQLSPYVVGIPQAAARTLPDWIGITETLEDVPHRSIILLDEAHLAYHSRNSFKRANTGVSRLLNLSRQRDQTVIFVTQEARQIDVNIASSANVIVFKEPSMLQFEFERRELRQLAQRATDAFTGLSSTRRKRSSYVHSPDNDFQGLLESELPSFWSSPLSKAFASEASSAPVRKPARPSRNEKQKRAIELSKAGWSLSRIAMDIGVSKATVVNYVKGYPYRGR